MAKAAKKVRAFDKWRAKKKFEAVAPEIFDSMPIGPIFAADAEKLPGRTIETTLSKLANSNQHHIKVLLEVIGNDGFTAKTAVKSVELSRAYISSQTNPGSDTVENVFSVETKDGRKTRFKTIMFTRGKTHTRQRKALRELARETIEKAAEKADYGRLVQEVVFGKLGSLVFNKGKSITPLGRVEIRKLELLK